jgi:hypothetical protein
MTVIGARYCQPHRDDVCLSPRFAAYLLDYVELVVDLGVSMPLHSKIFHQLDLTPLWSTDKHALLRTMEYVAQSPISNHHQNPMTDGWVVTPQVSFM